MLILCPSCGTSYDVEPASLGPEGRKVRCTRCRTVWPAKPRQADLLVAAARALAPDRVFENVPANLVAGVQLAPVETDGVAASGAGRSGEVIEAWPAQSGTAEIPADPPEPDSPESDPREPGRAQSRPADDSPDLDDLAATQAPPTAPVDLDAEPPPIDINADDRNIANATVGANSPHEDVETYAARRMRRSRRRRSWVWPMSRLQTAILALAIIDTALIGWRARVVGVLPQTASFYALIGLPVNLQGLVLDAVSTGAERHDGAPALVVQGRIVSDVDRTVAVPRLKLAVRDAARRTLYSWTAAPPRPTLPPGQAAVFRIRLATPPSGGRDVVVRFVTRRDAAAEAH